MLSNIYNITSYYQRLNVVLRYTGIVTSVVVLLFNRSDITFLFILPLSYSLSMYLVRNYYEHLGLAISIIEITKFCRLIILPILIIVENRFDGYDYYPMFHNQACFIIVYDTLCVSIILYIMYNKQKLIAVKRSNDGFSLSQWVLIVAWLVVVFIDSKLMNRLFNFTSVLMEYSFDSEDLTGGIPLIIYSSGIIVLYINIIRLVKQIIKEDSLSLLLSILVSILYASCCWFNGAFVSRWSLLLSIVISMGTLNYYYTEKRKSIINGGIFFISLAIVIASFLKQYSFGNVDMSISDSISEYLSSRWFDEYFSGIRCTSNGIHTVLKHAREVGWGHFFHDWFGGCPMINHVLGTDKLEYTNMFYREDMDAFQLIAPTTTMSQIVFGWIGVSFYSCIAAFFAIFFESLYLRTSVFHVKILIIPIIFWLSLFWAVNPNIIQNNVWKYLLVALVLYIPALIQKK